MRIELFTDCRRSVQKAVKPFLRHKRARDEDVANFSQALNVRSAIIMIQLFLFWVVMHASGAGCVQSSEQWMVENRGKSKYNEQVLEEIFPILSTSWLVLVIGIVPLLLLTLWIPSLSRTSLAYIMLIFFLQDLMPALQGELYYGMVV